MYITFGQVSAGLGQCSGSKPMCGGGLELACVESGGRGFYSWSCVPATSPLPPKKTPVEGAPCKKIISRGCGMQIDPSDERCNPDGVIKGGMCISKASANVAAIAAIVNAPLIGITPPPYVQQMQVCKMSNCRPQPPCKPGYKRVPQPSAGPCSCSRFTCQPIEGAPCTEWISRGNRIDGTFVNGRCQLKLPSNQVPLPQVAPRRRRISKTHMIIGVIVVLTLGIMLGSSLKR